MERTVNIKNVLIYALRKWYIMIVSMLAGGVLMGVYRFVKASRTVVKDEATGEVIGKLALSAVLKSAVKGVAIGIILGLAIYLCIMAVKYIYSKYMLDADMLKECFGYFNISNIYVNTAGKKFDRFLDRLEGCGNAVNLEKEYELIAAKIQVLAEDTSKPIMITGTVGIEDIQTICDNVRKNLPTGQLKVSAEPNPVYDADATLNLKYCSVIIVEAKNRSDIREVARLAEILKQSRATVLGTIIE